MLVTEDLSSAFRSFKKAGLIDCIGRIVSRRPGNSVALDLEFDLSSFAPRGHVVSNEARLSDQFHIFAVATVSNLTLSNLIKIYK